MLLLLLFGGRTGGQFDGTRMVGDGDGFGEGCVEGLITVRLSVEVVAMLETPDDDDKGGLHEDVGGQ